jgi:hypothetical protein
VAEQKKKCACCKQNCRQCFSRYPLLHHPDCIKEYKGLNRELGSPA